jgi:hypothetical protein
MGPLFLWDDLHQVKLNLGRIVILGQTDPLAHSMDMGVYHNPRNSEGVS